jgi:hypothetical protein
VILDNFAEFATVRQWLLAYHSYWNRSVEGEELDVLHRYCEFAGRDPDALIENLLRKTPTGTKLWVKRRSLEMARIDEFEDAARGGDVRGARDTGNTIRSFFIHNGVALTASPLR